MKSEWVRGCRRMSIPSHVPTNVLLATDCRAGNWVAGYERTCWHRRNERSGFERGLFDSWRLRQLWEADIRIYMYIYIFIYRARDDHDINDDLYWRWKSIGWLFFSNKHCTWFLDNILTSANEGNTTISGSSSCNKVFQACSRHALRSFKTGGTCHVWLMSVRDHSDIICIYLHHSGWVWITIYMSLARLMYRSASVSATSRTLTVLHWYPAYSRIILLYTPSQEVQIIAVALVHADVPILLLEVEFMYVLRIMYIHH